MDMSKEDIRPMEGGDIAFLRNREILEIGVIGRNRLAIEFDDDGDVRRAVFSCGEFGIRLEWTGLSGRSNYEDELKARISAAEDAMFKKGARMEFLAGHLRYSFIGRDGVEFLSITESEVLMMPKLVRDLFAHAASRNLETVRLPMLLWSGT